MAKIRRNDRPAAPAPQEGAAREFRTSGQEQPLPHTLEDPRPVSAPAQARSGGTGMPPPPARQTPQPSPHRGKRPPPAAASRRDRLYTLAMIVFAVIFLVSAGMLVKRFLDDRRTESEFAALAKLIDTGAAPADTGGEGEDAPSNAAKFAALKEQNGDFVGWISIEGTNLDFPVMQTTGDRADYYLRHDFNGDYSVYGVPYLDENCTLSNGGTSHNLIVYGHNMKTGTIFGCLTGYKSADYYAEHPYIEFDNIYYDATYEVFAAFSIDVAQDTDFVYNTYINMNQAVYDSYVAEVIARSDVDTGIVPQYGEDLLTLSTCEYSTDDGRYVVVARRVFR